MALSGLIQFEVRQTGGGAADTNGGGFKAGATGTDWSMAADGPQYNLSNGQTQGTAVILLAAAASDMVGNVAYVQGGTGGVVAGWYEILSVVAGVSITVDRLTGLTAGTGVTVRIGGALASPGLGAQLCSATGHKAWVKYNATPYSLTTTTVGVNGPVKFGTASINASVEGYEVTRGDRTANRPVIQWATTPGALTYACVHNGGGSSEMEFINLTVDGNSTANCGGFDIANFRATAIDCIAKNCNQAGAIGFNCAGAKVVRCQANTCLTGFVGSATTMLLGCDAIGCATAGFSAGTSFVKCMARGGGVGFTGLSTAILYECIADGNTTIGFNLGINTMAVNCASTNQSGGSGTGFTVQTPSKLINCATYNNTTAISGTPFANVGAIVLTADPYVNRAGGDFRPNNAAGGGALLQAIGLGVFGQTNNEDSGAVHHADPTGGGTTIFSGEF